jgi:gamma-glutamylcyclotransferase (GGCT)/AIG2-like uncharacterized protein YtfP
MQLYFAYGSNLDQEQMADRCPTARFYKFAVLPQNKLIFTGYSKVRLGSVASVIPDPQKYVEGVLYEVGDSDLESLDKYEGVPTSYTRTQVQVITDEGHPAQAWVYVKSEVTPPSPPSEGYYSLIYKHYARYGFNRSHLEEAKK